MTAPFITLAVGALVSAATVGAASAAATASAPNMIAGERVVGRPAPAQSVDFMVRLPLRDSAQLDALIENQGTRSSPLYHHFLTPTQFRAAFGPTSATIARTAAILRSHGLTITRTSSQILNVRGAVAAVEQTFSTKFAITRNVRGQTRLTPSLAVRMPTELAAVGASVHGLTRSAIVQSMARQVPAARNGEYRDFWFDDLKQAYSYPANGSFNGKGVTIATVGISDFSSADAQLYFNHERLGAAKADLAPAPKPLHYVIPGALSFSPGTGIAFEADLDVQQANGSALGATVIGVDAPAAGEGFLYAYSLIDDLNIASIVSTSYGGCELQALPSYSSTGTSSFALYQSYHDLFRQGNAQGITFVFSSGDSGGLGCQPPSYFLGGPGQKLPAIKGINFWANDPNVTAVGGTNLATTAIAGSRRSAYVSENDYADPLVPEDPYALGSLITGSVFGSGGGNSVVWAKPAYQTLVNTGTTGRAVPDISMQMGGCPIGSILPCGPGKSAAFEYFGGALVGAVGTSAAAPEFAGLLAVASESQGGARFGNVNPLIYELAANQHSFVGPFLHTNIPGNNGIVSNNRNVTYDVITGVGTPIANRLLLLPYAPLAGDPLTPTNP